MKVAVIILLVAATAYASPRMVGFNNFQGNAGNAGNAGFGRQNNAFAQRALTPTNPKANFGPRFYGAGLENPYAMPVNPFVAQQVKSIINRVPGALARVDLDGEITFTNQFGTEVDIVDAFGREQEIFEF